MLELRETEINENVSVETVQTDVLYFFSQKSTVLCFLQNVNNTFFLEKTALNWHNSLHVVNTQLKKTLKEIITSDVRNKSFRCNMMQCK